MLFKKVNLEDFYRIRQFYWDLIDEMSDQMIRLDGRKGFILQILFYRKVLTEENFLCWKRKGSFVQA